VRRPTDREANKKGDKNGNNCGQAEKAQQHGKSQGAEKHAAQTSVKRT